MAYILYRKSTVGSSLEETLDQFVQIGAIPETLSRQAMNQFDRTINQALPARVKNRLTFKSSRLRAYRFCDNVWTFILQDVEFREMQDIIKADKVKIVACDGKGTQNNRENEE